MHLCDTDLKLSRDELAEILLQDAGRRFEMDESRTRIRAKTDVAVDDRRERLILNHRKRLLCYS